MSFIDQWRAQVKDSLVECAKLTTTISDVDLKHELLVVGVLWPLRQPVQDFDVEAVEAVQEILGGQARLVLRMIQRWEDDRIAVARSLTAQLQDDAKLEVALNKLIQHFDAFPIFARQLASQVPSTSSAAPPAEAEPGGPLASPRVFISYDRSDGQTLATEVRQRLETESISLWHDLTHMEGGRDWWQQITEALDQVDFMVLIMTPAAAQSEMVRKEWRYAQQQGVCIYPVARDFDFDFTQLPHWIRQIHFYNLQIEWPKLIDNLKGDCQTPRIPFMAEDVPADFVGRPAELEQLVAHLFDQQRQESIANTIALVGAGGYGKTTLAKAVCHNDNIRQVFDNGVLWVTLGENPGDSSGYIIDLIEVLSGERPGFAGLDAAEVRLGELLADRDILLVIDDVWNSAHLKPFLRGGSRCARLITTRYMSVLPSDTKSVEIGAMQQDEAIALLSFDLPDGHLTERRQLATRLGEWPLLLKLVNGTLRDRVHESRQTLPAALTYVNSALDKHGLTAFDASSPVARDQAVSQTVEVSLELLDEAERARYYELVIFPEDISIPIATLEKLWEATGGLDDFDTEELCYRLHQLSLLSHLDLTSRYINFHKVMRSYLIYQKVVDVPTLHNQFLDAQSSSIEQWADIPPKDIYLWTYLAHHLVEAGRPDELVATVKDLRYLAAKTQVRGTYYAERDLLTAEQVAPDDNTLRLLQRTLSQLSHLFVRCRTMNEVANTLHSRLTHLPELTQIVAEGELALPKPLLTACHVLPDLPDPTLIRTLKGHSAGVFDCATSADGSTIVSIAKDNTLTVWETDTGTERFSLKEDKAELWGCAISADGTMIVSALSDGSLALWDARTKAERLSWSGHQAGVVSCAINADASVVVSASKDKTLKVWDAQTGAERLTLTGHQRTVTGCDISADGAVIVSASNDGTLKVWDAQTGVQRFSFTVQRVKIGIDRLTFFKQRDAQFNCAISADGTVVAATSLAGTLAVWDAQTGVEHFTLTADKRGAQGCALSADGSVVVCALNNGTLKVWDTVSGAELLTLANHSRVVNGCAISADGTIVVSASDDRTLKIWDGRSKKAHLTPIAYTDAAHSCAMSADGSVAVSAMANKTLKVWDVATGSERFTLKGHTRKVNECTICPAGTTVVSASQDQTVIVWDAQTGTERLALTGHAWAVTGCAISADGATIVSASDDKTLKIWDAAAGTERFTLQEHTRTVSSCAVSADGDTVVSASGDGTLIIWDARTGVKQTTLTGHTAWVNSCRVNANGTVIVSASFDKTLKVWDTTTGVERFTLQGHTLTVTGCAVSADGSVIVSVSRDKTLKVWSGQTGQCLATLFVDEPLLDCACSADASYIVAVGSGGVYYLRLVR